jgi:hypothetical protein
MGRQQCSPASDATVRSTIAACTTSRECSMSDEYYNSAKDKLQSSGYPDVTTAGR